MLNALERRVPGPWYDPGDTGGSSPENLIGPDSPLVAPAIQALFSGPFAEAIQRHINFVGKWSSQLELLQQIIQADITNHPIRAEYTKHFSNLYIGGLNAQSSEGKSLNMELELSVTKRRGERKLRITPVIVEETGAIKHQWAGLEITKRAQQTTASMKGFITKNGKVRPHPIEIQPIGGAGFNTLFDTVEKITKQIGVKAKPKPPQDTLQVSPRREDAGQEAAQQPLQQREQPAIPARREKPRRLELYQITAGEGSLTDALADPQRYLVRFFNNLRHPLDVFLGKLPIPPDLSDQQRDQAIAQQASLVELATKLQKFIAFPRGFEMTAGIIGSKARVIRIKNFPSGVMNEELNIQFSSASDEDVLPEMRYIKIQSMEMNPHTNKAIFGKAGLIILYFSYRNEFVLRRYTTDEEGKPIFAREHLRRVGTVSHEVFNNIFGILRALHANVSRGTVVEQVPQPNGEPVVTTYKEGLVPEAPTQPVIEKVETIQTSAGEVKVVHTTPRDDTMDYFRRRLQGEPVRREESDENGSEDQYADYEDFGADDEDEE